MPGIIAALADDPRTDDDSAYGNLTHTPTYGRYRPDDFQL
jgi:hypothetical protein